MVGRSVEQWQCIEKIHFVPFFAGTPWNGDAWRFYTNHLCGLGTLWHVARGTWCAPRSKILKKRLLHASIDMSMCDRYQYWILWINTVQTLGVLWPGIPSKIMHSKSLLFYAALIGFAAQYSCSFSCCYVSMCIALLLLLSFSLFLSLSFGSGPEGGDVH